MIAFLIASLRVHNRLQRKSSAWRKMAFLKIIEATAPQYKIRNINKYGIKVLQLNYNHVSDSDIIIEISQRMWTP